jgi:hypothetical protein
MSAAVSLPAAGLLWLGHHPKLYYMGGPVFVVLLWLGVAALYLCRTAISGARTFTGPAMSPLRAATTGFGRAFFLIPLAATLLIAFQIPLRLGFLTAWPALARLVEDAGTDGVPRLAADQRCGLYTISSTDNRTCHVPGRLFFVFADDPESAFIYSPSGIDHLCYNAGSKGHLFVDWYWMKED